MADDVKKLHAMADGGFRTAKAVNCLECGQICSGQICKACEMKNQMQ